MLSAFLRPTHATETFGRFLWLPDSNEKQLAPFCWPKPVPASSLQASDALGSPPIQTPGPRDFIARLVGNTWAKRIMSFFSNDHSEACAILR